MLQVLSKGDLQAAVDQLGGYGTGLYAEKWAPFEKELAIMVARCACDCLGVRASCKYCSRLHVTVLCYRGRQAILNVRCLAFFVSYPLYMKQYWSIGVVYTKG
jgi:hypothetical protein